MRWTIGRRLLAGSALPALIIVAMVVGGWLITGYLGRIQDEGARHAAAAVQAEAAAGAGPRLYQIIADGVINRNLAETDKDWRETKADVAALLTALEALHLTPAERAHMREVRAQYTALTQRFETVFLPMLRLTNAVTPEMRAEDGVIDEIAEKMANAAIALRDALKHQAEGDDAAFDQVRANSSAALLALGGLGFAVALLGTALINRSITQPLARLTGVLEQISRGRLDVTVTETERGDEIGAVALVVQDLQRQSAQVAQIRADQERERARAEEDKRAALRALADQFERGIKGVVRGVADSASRMQAAAQSLSASADQSDRQTRAVSEAADHAAANVEIAAAATEELSASVIEISRQVLESTRISNSAVEEAERTNAAIDGLTEATRKIGDVVKLINDIAGQTNLLALNATIEAARAGEAGKGFAVVASEVKTLANQTAKATEDIQTQVASMQAVTGAVVAAIGAITGVINRMNEIATGIAGAVEEQSAATQEIARNISEASRGAQDVSRNIGGVRQAVSETRDFSVGALGASDDLSGQSRALDQEVDRFIAQVRG